MLELEELLDELPELELELDELELDELELDELDELELELELEDPLELDELELDPEESELELDELELSIPPVSGEVAVSLQDSSGVMPAARTPPLRILRNSRRFSRSSSGVIGSLPSRSSRSITVAPWSRCARVRGSTMHPSRRDSAPLLRRSTTRFVG